MIPVLAWGAALSVSIGGVDRTADLVGAGEIDRELSMSGVATLRLAWDSGRPALGAAVAISGIVAVPYVGIVSGVQYDPADDTWVVTVTDGLQALCEGAATTAATLASAIEGATADTIVAAQVAAVLALMPAGAMWHPDLAGQWTDGWTGAQAALDTVCASIYIESGALHSVPWAGTGYTATISHAAGDIYEGSESLYLATSRELIREIGATVEVGYSRQYHWRLHVSWGMPQWDFCDWLWLHNCPLPTRSDVVNVVGGNAWALCLPSGAYTGRLDGVGVATEGLPKTGWVCNGDSWDLIQGAARGDVLETAWSNPDHGTIKEYVHSFECYMGRQWSQSLVDTYRLTVTTPAGTPGAVIEGERRSHDAPADDTGWDSGDASVGPRGAGWSEGEAPAYRDVLDPADRAAVVGGRLRQMARRLRASQRLSTMGCTVEPGAEPGLGARVRMIQRRHDYEGQVIRLRTTWDLSSHAAGCAVLMCISSGSASADDFEPPDPPVRGSVPDGVSLAPTLALGTHIGGGSAADLPQDPTWDGWVTNYQAHWGPNGYPVAGSQTYQQGLALVTPDVPAPCRDTWTAPVVSHSITIDPLDSGL